LDNSAPQFHASLPITGAVLMQRLDSGVGCGQVYSRDE